MTDAKASGKFNIGSTQDGYLDNSTEQSSGVPGNVEPNSIQSSKIKFDFTSESIPILNQPIWTSRLDQDRYRGLEILRLGLTIIPIWSSLFEASSDAS
ncbi:unnamed protein product [Allacma fusca]|uniref:Uncharacterized protein n=1 Tax=Allacma fusca TaxID=39272 RepID=A0A8J2P629_9HEXA|nr:unnamed protein product [Allacma fusca]